MAGITTERLDRDIASMCRDTYSDAQWVPPNDAEHSGFWAVPIRAKPDPKELENVVADLEHERTVDLSKNGKILEAKTCTAEHETVQDIEAIRSHLDSIPDVWNAMIVYPSDIADPKTWLRPSWWDTDVMSRHGHLNWDKSACVFYASTAGAWNPVENTLSEYVDQLAIWILKSEIWIARGALPDLAGWPGPGQSHELHVLLRASVNSRCECGSGRPYGTCHRPVHMKELLRSGSRSVWM
ncbi:SEC-C domain-containing protein [Dehalococcoides mccartyi]|nr:SEC-C domain-containing protein [Dehalococcoides mccartyi]